MKEHKHFEVISAQETEERIARLQRQIEELRYEIRNLSQNRDHDDSVPRHYHAR